MKKKILKNNRGSYYLNIPKEMIRELKWKDNQKVEIIKRGEALSIKDAK